MCGGCESAFYQAELLGHVVRIQNEKQTPNIYGITESRSLYEAIGSTKQVSDKRLQVEISALRNRCFMCRWSSATKQCAN